MGQGNGTERQPQSKQPKPQRRHRGPVLEESGESQSNCAGNREHDYVRGDVESESPEKESAEEQSCTEAASERMKYLGLALNDPMKYPPANSELRYLAIVHDVLRNKSEGKLLTARDHIEYSDASSRMQFSCSEVTGARIAFLKKRLNIQ